MDAGRGVLCRGPQGPYPYLPYWDAKIADMPSTVDLLQEDIFLRFLASLKSKEVDLALVNAMRWSNIIECASEMCNQPTVIATLTQTLTSRANNFIWESVSGSLLDVGLLENGLTR